MATLSAGLLCVTCLIPVQVQSTERMVTFAGVGGLTLQGTLLAPEGAKGKLPGVLLLPGSGPTDRNGNQPPALVADVLKQIAERLASEGYVSLRFDKRAVRSYAASWPRDVAAQNDFFSWDAFVGDAEAALSFLQIQAEVDAARTVIAGHSEGSMIAMQVGHDLQGKAAAPAGLILIGAPGRPGADILREQVVANLTRAGLPADQARPYTDYVDQALGQLAKDGTVPLPAPTGLAGLFPPSAAKLLRVELSFDPTTIAPAFLGPALVVQGEKDNQISSIRDTPRLAAAMRARPHGALDIHIVPSASHNLKQVDNEMVEPGVAGPIAPAALDIIASWMKKNFAVREQRR